jgi:hypothetical protein
VKWLTGNISFSIYELGDRVSTGPTTPGVLRCMTK